MSEVKVNKISPKTACGTTTLGDSGDTFTLPSGATMTVASGATISNLGTATGFGGTGVVSWDTASIKTTGFTAVTGTGYFCNTSGGIFTVTLPLSPSAGDVVGVADYAKTFDSNNLTLGRNGSNIGGSADDATIATEGIAVTLVYVDGTKGWIVTDSGLQSDAPGPVFVTATGGCVTTCGNFKMHTFLAPGTFCVSAGGNCAGSNTVDYLVIAGGGGGASTYGGGGGAGGYRESPGAASGCYTVSPLGVSPAAAVPVSAVPGAYPIVVGGGGVGGTPTYIAGTTGSLSSFDAIESAGGGGGGVGTTPASMLGKDGGSGGGGGSTNPAGTAAGGSGDTPPTPVAQGKDGGAGSHDAATFAAGGGGGGATGVGGSLPASPPVPRGGAGGTGATSSINTTPTGRAGGGGGGGHPATPSGGGTASCGGGAGGALPASPGVVGTINSGGGGGGGTCSTGLGALGGSGIVIIRYKYQ